jgi:chromosome segregation ATPase
MTCCRLLYCLHVSVGLQMQGTPGGAAAKQVAKLSMQKLRELQSRVAELEEAAAAADTQSTQLSASLDAAQGKLAGAKAEAAARAAEASGLAERMAQQASDMQLLQSKAQEEEEGRRTATTQVQVG